MKKILGKSHQQAPVLRGEVPSRGLKTEQVQLKAKLSEKGKYPGYMQSLPACDEIRRYDNEGSIGARTSFSAFSSLSNKNNDHKVMQEILAKNSAPNGKSPNAPQIDQDFHLSPPQNYVVSQARGFTSDARGFTNRLSTCQEEEDGEHPESREDDVTSSKEKCRDDVMKEKCREEMSRESSFNPMEFPSSRTPLNDKVFNFQV